MKLFRLLMIAFVATALFSCSSEPAGESAETGDATDTATASAAAKTYTVDTGSSIVNWEGSKPGGNHVGTIGLNKGTLSIKDGKIEAGEFVLDMKAMAATDEGMDDATKAKLVGHLSSPDFFDIATYPTATFVIAGVEPIDDVEGMTHTIKGNLKMKEQTKSVAFNANISITENGVTAESNNFKINRVDWGVNHGSTNVFKDLKDGIVNDQVGLKIRLVAN
ncbi:MAG: polyisoprenoid-binding protein YceI [Maribacter sp.]|jgi:polyisoprenoid-binding protein YceI